ncbi:MAG: putative toxin-antitoxin system toxin component, PIN family [Nitrospirota bacterium]
MKVVFDTNILVSAMLWRGTPYRCLLAIRAGLAELILSPPIIDEFRNVLDKKFALTREEVEEGIALVQESARLIGIPGTLRVLTDDPEDDKFIETALVAGAQCLVSGDKHLLRLGDYRGIKVISARAFLDMLAE